MAALTSKQSNTRKRLQSHEQRVPILMPYDGCPVLPSGQPFLFSRGYCRFNSARWNTLNGKV